MVLMDLFGGRNEDIDIENRLVNPVGEGLSGMNWESSRSVIAINIYIYIYIYIHMYIYIHIYPLSWTSLPLHPHSTPLGHHRAPDWALYVIQQLSTIYFTHDSVYLSMPIYAHCLWISHLWIHLLAKMYWSSQPRDQTTIFWGSCIAGGFFTN